MLAELEAKARIWQKITARLTATPDRKDSQAALIADLVRAREPLEELFTVRTFVTPDVSRRGFPPRTVLERVSVKRTLRDGETEYELKVDAVPTDTVPESAFDLRLPEIVVGSRLRVTVTDRNTGFEATASLPTVEDVLLKRINGSTAAQSLAYVQEVIDLLSSKNQEQT